MHDPVRENLEDYLARGVTSPEFEQHLATCSACSAEVSVMKQLSGCLQQLHSGAEPPPAFYARVLERIEQTRPASFWLPFLDPSFGRRVMLASASVVILIGTYLYSTEPRDAVPASPNVAVAAIQPTETPYLDGTPQRDRDAVLYNLASYHE